MHSEKEVLLKARKGNNKAFKILYEQNVNSLFRFLMQFSKDDDIVADCVQTAFIKAFSNIENFRGASRFSTWLFSIGINVMKDTLRSFYLQKKNDEMIENLDLHAEDIHDFEWHHDMRYLLEDIDDEKKAIFILHEVEGYSHNEIAEILGISEQNSRTRLSRTKQYLRVKWYSDEKA